MFLTGREIQVLGELLYNVLTTGVGIQTLGEEYCFIHKVTGQVKIGDLDLGCCSVGDGRRPTSVRRGVFIVCKVLIPYVIDRLSKREILMNLYSSNQPEAVPAVSEEASNSFEKMTNVMWTGWVMVREWCQRHSNAIKSEIDSLKD